MSFHLVNLRRLCLLISFLQPTQLITNFYTFFSSALMSQTTTKPKNTINCLNTPDPLSVGFFTELVSAPQGQLCQFLHSAPMHFCLHIMWTHFSGKELLCQNYLDYFSCNSSYSIFNTIFKRLTSDG